MGNSFPLFIHLDITQSDVTEEKKVVKK
jgi:hypothetical protein